LSSSLSPLEAFNVILPVSFLTVLFRACFRLAGGGGREPPPPSSAAAAAARAVREPSTILIY